MAYSKVLIVTFLLLVEAESCNGSDGWSSDELVGDQREYKGEDKEFQYSSTNES